MGHFGQVRFKWNRNQMRLTSQGIRCCRLLILTCLAAFVLCGAEAAGCSGGTLTFERTPSVSPSEELFSRSDLFYWLKETNPLECHEKCFKEEDCTGYFVNYQNGSCLVTGLKHEEIVTHLLSSERWSYHRKICIAGTICKRQWAFERMANAQLLGLDEKVIKEVASSDFCLEACAVEKTFICRSARYDSTHKQCTLSRHDRRTAPDAFKVVPQAARGIEYLENQCVAEPTRCLFAEQKGWALLHSHVHVETNAPNREYCERACLQHTDFTCRTFVYDAQRALCMLSPDDRKSLPSTTSGTIGTPANDTQGQVLYERGSCVEVEMQCDATTMTAVVRVSAPFRGRLFALGHPYECYATANSDGNEVALTMPLHGRRCGTRNLGNGTFVNSVVIQHHPFILRSTDRRIDVACDYEEVHQKLRAGKQVLEGEFQGLTQVITGLAPTPPIRLRVVNANGNEIQGVDLGDQLYLKVELLDQSVFGIFGSNLVARSGEGSESVLLINEKGCPVEPSVFPVFEREQNDSKSLVAAFQAFRFASDSLVKFQMTVSFCLDTCPPVECEDESTNEVHESYGRRKRRAALHSEEDGGNSFTNPLDFQAGDVVTDVTMETSAFVVNSLKATHSTEEKAKKPLKKLAVAESVQVSENGLCFTPALFYSAICIGIIVQLAIFGVCIFLVILRKKSKIRCGPDSDGSPYSSRASISSKTGLFVRTNNAQ